MVIDVPGIYRVVLGETALSDHDMGKKEQERSELTYFLAEYQYITGRVLKELYACERPDFICVDEGGHTVGVELTRIGNSPPEAVDSRVFWGDEPVPLDTLFDHVYAAVERKSQMVGSADWNTLDENILVLTMFDPVDPPLESWFSDESLVYEFVSYKFSEVWIADYSIVEAYGTVQLYGLYPVVYWGVHLHRKSGNKPYG